MDGTGAGRVVTAGRALRLADLARLGAAVDAVRRSGWADLLQVTAEQVRELVGAAGAVVTSVRDDGRRVTRGGTGQRPDDPVAPSLEVCLQEAVATGRPVLGAEGALAVPVLGDVGSVAVLLVLPGVGRPLDEVDVELAQQVCRAAAHRWQVGQGAADAEVLRAALLGSLDEGVMITRGPQQRVTLVSPVLEAALAVTPGEMDGRPVSLRGWSWLDADGSLRPADDMPTWQAYRTGQPVFGETMRIVPADGQGTTRSDGEDVTRWVVVSAQPVVDPLTGEVEAVVTRVRDVTGSHRVSLQRREESDRMHAAQQVAGLAWTTYDPVADTLVWSDEMYRIAGLDPEGERIDVRRFVAMLHPADRSVFSSLDDIVEGRLRRLVRYRIVRPDGQVRSLQAWTEEQREDGALVLLHGAVLDVTDHERTVTEVAERRRQFETAFDGAPYGMLVVSTAPATAGRVVRVNRALAVLVDRPVPAIGGLVQDVLIAPEGDTAPPLDLPGLAAAGRDGQRLQRRVLRSDGSVRHVWVTVIPALDTSVSEPFLVVHVLDVTSQNNQQRALERIALTDAVTGLANRSMVTVRMDQALAAADRPLALMMLDLDRFKMVNDSLGHQVGDLLLVAVADRLRALAPSGALVARLGGDEFVVMVHGPRAADPEPLAAELVDDLARPYELSSGHRVVSSVSVGVAVVSEQQPSRLDLLRDADLALYRAKELGRNQFVVCDDVLLARAEGRLQDEQRLRDGLDAGRLRLHLQPLHDLATGRLRALEALVRLEDPELGLLGPDRFVPIAEETGLVAEIDHWMVDAALAVIGSDPRFVVDPQLRVAVNMSGRTLERPDFTARLTQALDRHGTDPHRLALEITETCLLDDDGGTIAMLRGLRALGITVCIDDFGTGYSALSYLQTFQVDVLKVDRAFVEALSSPGEQARATLTAIITMAHALGLLVVAEGVETLAQRDTLLSLGCDWAQGWHYGHPVPPVPPPRGESAGLVATS